MLWETDPYCLLPVTSDAGSPWAGHMPSPKIITCQGGSLNGFQVSPCPSDMGWWGMALLSLSPATLDSSLVQWAISFLLRLTVSNSIYSTHNTSITVVEGLMLECLRKRIGNTFVDSSKISLCFAWKPDSSKNRTDIHYTLKIANRRKGSW